jgi:hypothetical protein
VDHARAEFSCSDAAAATPVAALTAAPSSLARLSPGLTGLVDGADFYGPIAFQSGRFRRIALLPEVTRASCRALVRGEDDRPWFDPRGPHAVSGILLGSPGINDACLQAVQACVPHRRLRPAGCASVAFSGLAAEGPVEIRATAAAAADSAARPDQPVPVIPAQAPRPGAEADQVGQESRPPGGKARRASRRSQAGPPVPPARGIRPGDAAPPALADAPAGLATAASVPAEAAARLWDIEAVDAAGHLLAAWRGVEMHDAGPLPRNVAWPPPLLSVYLEGSASALGLDPALRVVTSCGQPTRPGPSVVAPAVPRQPAGTEEGEPGQAAAATGPRQHHASAIGTGALDGFTLSVGAPVPVACGWSAVETVHRPSPPAAAMAGAYARLRAELAESPALLAARLRAVAACLSRSGPDSREPVTCRFVTSEGWALLAAGPARIACTVVEVSGVPSPVALALLTTAETADGKHAPGRTRATAARSGGPG